jgi:hypothetical protein
MDEIRAPGADPDSQRRDLKARLAAAQTRGDAGEVDKLGEQLRAVTSRQEAAQVRLAAAAAAPGGEAEARKTPPQGRAPKADTKQATTTQATTTQSDAKPATTGAAGKD